MTHIFNTFFNTLTSLGGDLSATEEVSAPCNEIGASAAWKLLSSERNSWIADVTKPQTNDASPHARRPLDRSNSPLLPPTDRMPGTVAPHKQRYQWMRPAKESSQRAHGRPHTNRPTVSKDELRLLGDFRYEAPVNIGRALRTHHLHSVPADAVSVPDPSTYIPEDMPKVSEAKL